MKGGGERLHNGRESLHNGATPICILWGIRPLYNGPIKRNNVVYKGKAIFTEHLEADRLQVC